MVVSRGSEIMVGLVLQRQNFCWSWVVLGSGGKIMNGRELSWMVVNGRGWSHDLIMP